MKKQQQIQPYLSSKHNPIALKKLQNCKTKSNTNLTNTSQCLSAYLIGQNFCKKQNTKQIFIMALLKKEQTENKKARELFFSRPNKKENNQTSF